jgi:hypothetical protein
MKRYKQIKPLTEQNTKPTNISKADKEKQSRTEYNQPIQDAIKKLKNEIENSRLDLKYLSRDDEDYIQKRQDLNSKIKSQEEALQKLQNTLEKEGK